MEPALFRAFPGLRLRLPHVAFVREPTPVEPLALPLERSGPLFVKRDEQSCPLYGGNKPRKLEFVLGHARQRGTRRLVTTGGIGTNHGLATTILGRSLGMRTSLVLVDQPVTDEVRSKLLLDAAWGAELVYGGNLAGAVLGVARVLVRSSLGGERPYLVPTGGSSPRGNLGFVSAGLELASQIEHGLCPVPARIYLPVGTGGSVVGLVLGLRLAGLASRVCGVLVTDILPPSSRSLLREARRALALLRRADPGVPEVSLGLDDFPLLRGQLGTGYGATTPAATEAVALARARGLQLDGTYTGKCLAALRADAERGLLGGDHPVLFWNTYAPAERAAAPPEPPSPERIPLRLRRHVGLT